MNIGRYEAKIIYITQLHSHIHTHEDVVPMIQSNEDGVKSEMHWNRQPICDSLSGD